MKPNDEAPTVVPSLMVLACLNKANIKVKVNVGETATLRAWLICLTLLSHLWKRLQTWEQTWGCQYRGSRNKQTCKEHEMSEIILRLLIICLQANVFFLFLCTLCIIHISVNVMSNWIFKLPPSLHFRLVNFDFPLWGCDYGIPETDVSAPHNTLQAPKCVLPQSRHDR